jgi:hypothetical protein
MPDTSSRGSLMYIKPVFEEVFAETGRLLVEKRDKHQGLK